MKCSDKILPRDDNFSLLSLLSSFLHFLWFPLFLSLILSTEIPSLNQLSQIDKSCSTHMMITYILSPPMTAVSFIHSRISDAHPHQQHPIPPVKVHPHISSSFSSSSYREWGMVYKSESKSSHKWSSHCFFSEAAFTLQKRMCRDRAVDAIFMEDFMPSCPPWYYL